MKKQSIIQVFLFLLMSLLLVSVLLVFTSCGNPLGEREYLEDIYIDMIMSIYQYWVILVIKK